MIQQPEVEEQPTRLPGECFSCKATQLSAGRTWFLDTDVDYFDTPSYRIQICNICFDILANKCGYIKIGEEVEQYKRAIAKLEEQLHALRKYRFATELLGIDDEHLNSLIARGSSNVESESTDVIDSGPTKRVRTKNPSGSVGSGETGLSESTDDERVDKLRPTDKSVSVTI